MQVIVCQVCGALHSLEEAEGNCAVCRSNLQGLASIGVAGVGVRREGIGFVVSRYFTSEAAAQRGLNLLLTVNEAAFEPMQAYDAHPGSLNLPSNEDGS